MAVLCSPGSPRVCLAPPAQVCGGCTDGSVGLGWGEWGE